MSAENPQTQSVKGKVQPSLRLVCEALAWLESRPTVQAKFALDAQKRQEEIKRFGLAAVLPYDLDDPC